MNEKRNRWKIFFFKQQRKTAFSFDNRNRKPYGALQEYFSFNRRTTVSFMSQMWMKHERKFRFCLSRSSSNIKSFHCCAGTSRRRLFFIPLNHHSPNKNNRTSSGLARCPDAFDCWRFCNIFTLFSTRW